MTRKNFLLNSTGINLLLKVIIFLTLLSIGFSDKISAQINPLTACSLSGQSPVTVGDTWTYTFTGSGCPTPTSWTVSCGSILSSTSTSVTVYFNVLNCSSALITAVGTTYSKTVTVNQPPLTGGSINNPTQTINYNTAPAQITATAASGGSCSGSYTYQWYSSPNNSTYTIISGATGQNYQPPALTATTYYKRNTTCSSSSAYTSNIATITVYPQLVPGNVYLTDNPGVSNETINYNHTSGQMTISGVSGGNGTYTYQWQSSPNNSTWTPISGATSTTYTSPNLTSTIYYNVAVSSNGITLNSISFNVIVNPQVFPGSIYPTYFALQSGASPGQINVTSPSGGGCGGSFTYQWQNSTDGVTYSNISGATSASYTPGTLTSAIWYRRSVTCSGDIEYSNPSQVTIATSSVNLNFIRMRSVLKPGVTDTVTADGLTSPYDVAQSTQYFDGIGRAVQTVVKQASPLQNDVVSFVVYDNFGRQPNQYLPYTASTNDGNYKNTALGDANTFNAAQFAGEQYYFSEINYEASPLNRVLNNYAPGVSWVGNNTGSSAQYLINTASDSVQLWSISSVQLSIPVNNGAYSAGQLLKTIGTDEAGHQVVEYKDKLGKTILKKVQLSSTPSTGHAGWLNTYYVYDTLQNLRFIIQPQAVALINGTWTISSGIANELCFRYEYDGRRRVVIKKVPGAGQQWMVYDARNRVAMTQDSALRSLQKWMFIKYDAENRPDSTGLITDPSHYNTPAYHDTLAYYSTSYPTVSSYTNELLTMNFYDDYNWVSTYSAPVGSSMATNYTSNSSYFITSYNTSPTYAVAITPFLVTHGMPTGSMKKVIGTTNQYLYASNFYDDRGRIIQTQSVNYTGGLDTSTIQYNFDGTVLRSLLNHKKNGNTVQSHMVLTKMDYDAGFRIRHIYKNIDNASSDQLIDSLQYNERGQLHAKYIGNNVDSLIYDYNIRGWLTGINKNYVAGTTNHYFGMELGYDKTTSAAPGNTYSSPEFNGNIEGEVWKSAGSGTNRKYDFTYDNSNRLTSANFTQYNGSGFDKSAGVDFSVSNLSYDANGNILTMEQKGFLVGGSTFIDELKYSYQTNSNKLSQVYDTADNPTSLLGDFHYNTTTKQSTDYNYDGNGNLVQDNNKAINSITYNYLNLQQLVHMNGEGNITYTYDAGGAKLSKVITDSLSKHSTTILYIGPFIYQQKDTLSSPGTGVDTLQLIGHEEGRVRWAYHKYTTGVTAYKYEYDFFEKDHLGNTRIVLTQEKDTSNYLASMETAYRTTEAQLFNNITNTSYAWSSVPGSSGIPSGTKLAITNPNDSVSKVDYNGTTGQKTGPSLLLKVMSGDTLNFAVQSYYNTNSTTTTNSSFTDVLNSLASGIVNTATGGAEGSLSNFTASGSPVYSGLSSFLTNNDPAPAAGYPKAYLNWIFLDDQFNYVSSSSGSIAAANSSKPAATLNTLAPGASLTMPKNGYLYIWVSNETQGWDVFFDNLSVQYKTGPVLEENHYYPFGLVMAGISDKAIKSQYIENKYRYDQGTELQNKEFSDGSGLEMYETTFRGLDPQLGRFSQIDRMADKFSFFTPYNYAVNNPVSANDPSGLKSQNPETIAKMQQIMNSGGHGGGSNVDQSIEASDEATSYGSQGFMSASDQFYWANVFSQFNSGGGNEGNNSTENSVGNDPNWTYNYQYQQTKVKQVDINGQSMTQVTLDIYKEQSFDVASLDEDGFWRETDIELNIIIDGAGKIQESNMSYIVTDHNSPYSNDGSDITVSSEINGCVSVQQNGSNFTFTSDAGNKVVSNGTAFGSFLNGVMNFNYHSATQFPTALAQDYLDGTNTAISILGIGSKAVSIGSPFFGFLAPSAQTIASYPQTIMTVDNQGYFKYFEGYGKAQ